MSESNTTAEWGLIGPGHVGQEIMRQIAQPKIAERLGLHPQPTFVVRRAGIMDSDGTTPSTYSSLDDIDNFPDVTFVAMDTQEDGAVATKYISEVLGRGAVAVTAEKGALANNFVELQDESDDFARLGINATVGGGTRLLEVAESWCRDPDNITEIHLALNGTLSAIWSWVGTKEGDALSLNRAIELAGKLEYAEPGATDSYEVIRGEAQGDIPKKTAIFFNKIGLADSLLDFHDLQVHLGNDEIRAAYERAKDHRFIVSLYSDKSWGPESEKDIIGGFDIEHAGWRIVSGFRNMNRNPLFGRLSKITGPGSGLVVGLGPNETDGSYGMTGDGAGVSPTANAMIDDYLLKTHKKIKRVG